MTNTELNNLINESLSFIEATCSRLSFGDISMENATAAIASECDRVRELLIRQPE